MLFRAGRRWTGGKAGNTEDEALIKMVLGVEGHSVTGGEKMGEVIIDASPRELDNGFLLRPQAGEGDLGIGRGGNKGKFLWRKHMTGKRFAVTPDALDIDTDGLV